MRPMFAVFVATMLVSHATMAASPTIPPAALNPTPNALSIDNHLSGDADLSNDSKTLEGVDHGASADTGVIRLNVAKDHYLRMNNQLGADTRNHASKATLKQDRTSVTAAKKQLDLASKACVADAKADSTSEAMCK